MGMHTPGTLVRTEPLPAPLWPRHAAAAYRVWYRGIGYDGSGRTVTGSVFVPDGDAPAEGWPVMSYAHGTTGLCDNTAPSTVGLTPPERQHVGQWLAAGHLVTATDYEGLASPGPHPYFNGEAVADDVIDIVRAATALDHPVSRRWTAVGFSQGGHAALFTGLMATRYAPELDYRGTVALAPPVHVRSIIELQTTDPDGPVTLFLPYLLAGLRGVSDLRTAGFLTGLGERLVALAERAPVRDVHYAVAVLTNSDLGTTDLVHRPEVSALLRACRVPTVRFDRPVLIAAGCADAVVPLPVVRQFIDDIGGTGAWTQLITCPDTDHSHMLSAATDNAIAWAQTQFGDGVEQQPCAALLLDATGDGEVTADDFEAFALRLVQSCGEAPGSPRAGAVRDGYRAVWQALADRADTSHDGRITVAEFQAWIESRCDEAAFDREIAPLAHAVVALVDTDHNGTLDAVDLARLNIHASGAITATDLIATISDFCRNPTPHHPGGWIFGQM